MLQDLYDLHLELLAEGMKETRNVSEFIFRQYEVNVPIGMADKLDFSPNDTRLYTPLFQEREEPGDNFPRFTL